MNIHTICECFFRLIINLPFNLYICQQAWTAHVYKNQRTTFILKYTMIKYIQILIVLLLLSNSTAVSQNNDWEQPLYSFLDGKVSKLDGNIRYTMDSMLHIDERNRAIDTIKQYIASNLSLIKEDDFEESVHIVLTRDRKEMAKYVGSKIIGAYIPMDNHVPENMLFCVYWKKHNVLKHEIMHMIVTSKWGGIETNNGRAAWLEEGLAVYANPEAENCDGYTIEERYAYLLQNDKLLDFDSLFTSSEADPNYKLSYSQSGYLVSFLIKNYGIAKLKELWQSDVQDFEKIYGTKFESLVSNMHHILSKKYVDPISFDIENFKRNCIE